MKDPKEVLRSYASDMLAVEKQLMEAVERQTRDKDVRYHREAYEILMKIETVLSGHVISLEQYLSSINGGATPESLFKKAATTAMGAVAGLYDKMRMEETVSRDLRDDYASLSLAAISYTMLHTTASALDDTKLAELALNNLNELTPLIVNLSRVIPPVVARELTIEGKAIDSAVGQDAVSKTQKAWSHEIVDKLS